MSTRGRSQRVCRFYQRGDCWFGSICRNLHMESTEQAGSSRENMTSRSPDSSSSLGACSLPYQLETIPSPSKSSKIDLSVFGPTTSSDEEALELVKKAESTDKTCGICFDIVIDKPFDWEQMFGILPNCNHCFCFPCIMQWRKTKEFDLEVAQSCPECRICSDYVYSSRYWIDNKEEKEEFIAIEKRKMKEKPCRFYRRGICQFGDACMYGHDNESSTGAQPIMGSDSVRRALDRILSILNFNLTENDDYDDTDNTDADNGGDVDNGSDIDDEDDIDVGDDSNEGEDNEDDEDDYDDDEYELDLDDPCIAVQYYEKGDIEYYIAMNRLVNGEDSSDESDYDFI